MSDARIARFEQLIRTDPAGRGLVTSESELGALCVGQLAAAANDLARRGRRVAIVTGFFIPRADPPAAETDGPPGAVLLARALRAIGIEVTIITDEPCGPAVAAAVAAAGLDDRLLEIAPVETAAAWCDDFLADAARRPLSHVVAVERVGPSHTETSLAGQSRDDEPPLEQFRDAVPPESRGRCHNMRGVVIDEWTADFSPLFERLTGSCPAGRTIGVGDGGNELGMGTLAWEELVRRLPGDSAAVIPCRVPADSTILAGTSNWGAQALALAVLLERGRPEALAEWTCRREEELLETMVREGPAVDGVLHRPQPTVDGLPLATYLQPWGAMRGLLGWAE